ncbi:GNAT family N-acetyltransferase [Roseibium salinum]|uniref:GNAT family N-acetyltransferase n=1 Tax=Roseibium salinum TaxID=1604349 RepID=A0ABT3QYK7_9HYPH|nr:GNAT family N-acetyltransferase [Roseibium sp. DSM 29163]MCX2721928.1 GNAT family N-acetyltransferase [Roseibium sp. DSM 29163]
MTAGIIFRKAELRDRNGLTDLCMRSKQSNGYDDAFMAQCAEELRVRDSWILRDEFWLGEADGRSLVGCIRLSVGDDGEAGELETCFVDPAWRGKGVGRQLFDRLKSDAQAHNLTCIGLDADPFAEAFYARMGFRTVGRSPSGSIPGRTLPRMELILDRPPQVVAGAGR